MPTVKLVLDDSQTRYKPTEKGEVSYTSRLTNLTVDGINFSKDGRGDICKLSFLEGIKWSEREKGEDVGALKDGYSDWVACFDAYEDNLETLQSLNRGDSVNVIFKLEKWEKGFSQNIKYIETSEDKSGTPSVHEEIPHTTQKVDIPIEEPEEKQSTPSVHEVEVEDTSLPPEAEFRFAIPYHDRRNLSIQRQKSIEFAINYLDLFKDVGKGISDEYYEEIQNIIWNGIQELWKDIPSTVENGENSKK